MPDTRRSSAGAGRDARRAASRLRLEPATPADVAEIAALRLAVALDLTRRFGKGPWSSSGTERGVLSQMRTSRLCVARRGGKVAATMRLATRKPWAIDTKYFTACARPLYLTDMAVRPELQGKGIGRQCLEEAMLLARAWPCDAIRLDAFAASAGAGDFYVKCGFREVGRARYHGAALIYFERKV